MGTFWTALPTLSSPGAMVGVYMQLCFQERQMGWGGRAWSCSLARLCPFSFDSGHTEGVVADRESEQ